MRIMFFVGVVVDGGCVDVDVVGFYIGEGFFF